MLVFRPILVDSLSGIEGSRPAGVMNICLLWMSCLVVVEATATGWSLVQGVISDVYAAMCVIRYIQILFIYSV